jgi:uncharacterized protein (TIRG00374 family)
MKIAAKGAAFMRKTITTIIKILIGSGLVAYFVLSNDMAAIWQNFREITPSVWLTVTALWAVSVLVLAKKWQLLLPTYRYKNLLTINLISNFYTLVLPGQLVSEAIKAYILGKQEQELEKVSASVVVDKIASLVALMLLGTGGLFLARQNFEKDLFVVFIGVTFLIILALFIINVPVVDRLLTAVLAFIHRKIRILGKITNMLLKAKDCWREYSRDWKTIVKCVLLGGVFHLLSCLTALSFSNAVGADVAYIDWFWIYAIMSVVLLLPVTIGGIGLREGTLIGMLGLLDVPPEKALSISFGFFGFYIIRAVVGGVLEMLRHMGKGEHD